MLNKLITLAVDVAATYRLTKLVLDDGITEDLRDLVWSKFPPQETKIGYFFTCPWCVSIWAGAAIFTLRKTNPFVADIVSKTLASSFAVGKAYESGI